MHDDEKRELRGALLRRREDLVLAWYRAISPLASHPGGSAETCERLGDLVDGAIAFLAHDTDAVGVPEAMGSALASIDSVPPEAIGHSLELLATELPGGLAGDTLAYLQPRLARLLGGMAAGHARTTRDNILAQQQAIQRALLLAREGAEHALREGESLFRTLAEVTPAGILIISRDEPVYTNPGFETLIGYSLEELRTIDVFKLLAPESLLKLRGTVDAFRRELQSDPIELQIRTKSNELKWVSASWHAIELSGELAWMTTVYDITLRVETAERFQTYAKHLELLAEIDRAGLMTQSKPEIASAALRMITEFIRCDRTSITEVDSAHHTMRVLAVAPQRQTRITIGRRFHLENWQRLAETMKEGIFYVSDLEQVPARTPLQEEIYSEGLRSYMSATLSSKGRLIGMLNLGSFRPDAFSKQDQEIVREVAQRVAIVLRNAQLIAELEGSQQRLGELSRQLVLVQEAERRHLARELHDEIGQTLTALGISLELATHTTGVSRNDRIGEAQRRVEDLSQRVRQLSLTLRPPMLDDLGLLPTLLWYFDLCAQQYHIEVDFEQQGLERSFGSELEIVVYRIVQEALTNIARHAGAGSAVVRLWADSTTLSVQVEDRGRGFNVDEVLGRPASGGLSGIRERVRLVGGQLIVDSHPDSGSCLTALIPLAHIARLG